MELAPHSWSQGGILRNNSDFEDDDSNNDESMSDEGSGLNTDNSLPRQSVVRRTSATHMGINDDQPQTHKSKPNDESSEAESIISDYVPDNNGLLSLWVRLPKAYSSGLLPSNHLDVNETKLVCHSASAFYNQTTSKRTTTGRCFYKDNESIESDSSNNHSNSQRKAAVRRTKYAYFSDDSFEDDEPSRTTNRTKKKKQTLGGYDSDSEFVVSDDNYDEVSDSYGSESLTETSSDDYIPYAKSNKVGKKRNRKQRGSSEEDWGRMKHRKEQAYSDISGSDSDYMPGSSFARKTSRLSSKVGKKKKKRGGSEYEEEDDYDEELEGFTRTTGRQREFISYKEDSDGGSNDESGEENMKMVEGEKPLEEEDNKEKIERVLLSRTGRIGETGKTSYSLLNQSDGSIEHSNTQQTATEKQYLVKWTGWSHLHNTWETELTLLKAEVKGIQRLYNYMKKEEEKQNWEADATPEEIEYLKIQDELTEQLLEQYKEVERVIDARRTEEGCGQEYRCKWKGLPYSECTWEDGALIMDSYGEKIEMFERRKDSDCIPCQSAKVLKHRPKFSILKSQPMFLGGEKADQLHLRDYQLDGVNWLVHSWCKNNSVILADEMGLGKTIQSISFLSSLFHVHALYGPFLLVVPLSTLPAWQREFELWAPEFNLIVYIGDIDSRTMIREHEWSYNNNKLKFNAVVTTYEILLKDKDFLSDISWAVLVVDEAHRLKNEDSLLYRTLMAFHTNHRLLITGTPLQNSLKELWSLLHFIMKDKFSRWECFEEAHRDYGSGDGSGLASLHKELEPFLLRRVKKDVEKSLPAKVEQILRVEMSSVQKQYYRWIITKNYKALSKGVKGSIQGFLNIVMELKKCCNHAYIVRQPDTPDMKDPLQSLLRGSGKLYLLDKLLVRLKETGHRVLIFSQMVRMLDMLAEYMKYRRFQFQRLDGSITGQQRKDAIDHFNAEGSQDFCFLLSTRAGGLGVNLATADTVVIFDSDWNPQNDLQAQARAHRIGQTRQVNIYRLVTRNSVEEDIVERAKKKMVLDHLVIQKMDTTGRTILNKTRESSNNVPFDKNELNAILKFGTEELFKEGEKEEDKELKEMDIDEILRRAETQEVIEEGSVGNDLLSQFKMANFAIDEKELGGGLQPDRRMSTTAEAQIDSKGWNEIIPKSYLAKIEEEEKQMEQMQLYLPPRQRNIKTYNEDGTVIKQPNKRNNPRTSGVNEKNKRKDTRERKVVNEIIVNKQLPGFEGNEIRRFVSAYRKFSAPYTRLDSIAALAELQEKSLSELQDLATVLHDGCVEADEIYRQVSVSSEGESSVSQPVLRLCGINIPASSILEREKELQVLSSCIPSDPQARKRFRLVARTKPVSWPGVKWANVDDSRLLIGIYQHGLGNWESIKDDPEIGLTKKILPDNKQMKPQASHLKTRGEYLIKLLNSEKKASAKNSTDKKVQRTKSSKVAKTKTKSEKISKYFKPKESKRTKKKQQKVEYQDSEEDMDEEETMEESDDEEDDDDDIDEEEWKYNGGRGGKGRSRKRPNTSKRQPKGTNKGVVSRSEGRSSHYNGKQGAVKELKKRGGKSSKSSNSMEEEDIESDYELEDSVFQQCKAILKPVKKCLMHLPPIPDDNPSSSNSSDKKTLLEIGDLIASSLTNFDSDKVARQWRSHLWIFVAKFSAVSGKRLYNYYKRIKASY